MLMQNRTILASAAIAVVASLGALLPASARPAFDTEGQLLAQSSGTPSGNPSTMQDPNRPNATSDPSQLDVPRDQRDAPPTSGTEAGMQRPGTGTGASGTGTPTSQDPNRPDATSDPAQLGTPRDQRDAPPASTPGTGTSQGGSTTQQRTTTQQNYQTQPSTGTSSGYSTNEPVRGLW
ncbi:MAG: hypothetical protein SFY66_25815 [Oculatellaceae cyanobacterium bins.114]|nr:hypothetical protein [Oculatellaceae cyanobacterium bins.114]